MLENHSKETEEEEVGFWFYAPVILAALMVLVGSLFALNYFEIISFSESALLTGKTETAKVNFSSKNREPAKAALNAIGEINSVASVGANYLQFTNSIQSAKIKFDIAMRDLDVQTAADQEIELQLTEVFNCYLDAKDAWGEFLEHGDKYGFLLPNQYSKIHKLSSTYGFKRSKNGEFYKDEVLRAILTEADRKFLNVRLNMK